MRFRNGLKKLKSMTLGKLLEKLESSPGPVVVICAGDSLDEEPVKTTERRSCSQEPKGRECVARSSISLSNLLRIERSSVSSAIKSFNKKRSEDQGKIHCPAETGRTGYRATTETWSDFFKSRGIIQKKEEPVVMMHSPEVACRAGEETTSGVSSYIKRFNDHRRKKGLKWIQCPGQTGRGKGYRAHESTWEDFFKWREESRRS